MQIWYDPVTMQVTAIYRGCTYGGEARQKQGHVAIDASDYLPLTLDHRIVLRDGEVFDWVDSPNPVQPAAVPAPRDPLAEIDRLRDEVEALKAGRG